MPGHGNKYERMAPALVAALLHAPNYEAAARTIGVNVETVYRWAKRPDFQELLQAAKKQVVDHTVARLSNLSGRAVTALEKHLDGGDPSLEVKVALSVLEHVRAFADQEQLEERLTKMEEEMAKRLGGKR